MSVISPGTQIEFRCGDRVREIDGRHVGRVDACFEMTVRVRWEDSGWRSDLPISEVALVERVAVVAPREPRWRPATLVMSPRRQLELWMAERRAG